MQNPYYTIKELAEHLQVKQNTIYNWITNNRIPALKIVGQWRFQKSAIEEWIKNNEKEHKQVRIDDQKEKNSGLFCLKVPEFIHSKTRESNLSLTNVNIEQSNSDMNDKEIKLSPINAVTTTEIESADLPTEDISPNINAGSLSERRRFERLSESLLVKFKSDHPTESEEEYAAVSKNLSEGGMFIETAPVREKTFSELFHPQKKISLQFNLPSNAEPISTIARIVWVENKETHLEGKISAIGLEFVEIPNNEKKLFISFVAEELKSKSIDQIKKINLIPRKKGSNYTKDFVQQRLQWLSEQTKTKFHHLSSYSIAPEDTQGNVENFIGVAQIPIGIAGPLKVNGEYAKGLFYVPFATTEGAIVETYQRGMLAVSKAGGVNTIIHKDENSVDPVFLFKNIQQVKNFIAWINANFLKIKQEAETTTKYGKLLKITPYPIGRRVILNFTYFTADAMGSNMINVATEKACAFISRETSAKEYLLRSNFASEKKLSFANFLLGFGKGLSADVVLPRSIVKKYLGCYPEDISDGWHSWALGSFQSGIMGPNAQYANALAAIFIACGQDPAHITNASSGITMWEVTATGDLYSAIKLPNIIVGTVGGGTALGTQRECLEMLGCYGQGKARKFAEIVAAALIAGENAFCAAIVTGKFLRPHKRARQYTKEKVN